MSISQYKNSGLLAILNYSAIVFIIAALIAFSWVFLFIYRYMYTVIIQEAAIVNLKSSLVVTKVNKAKFDDIKKTFEAKQSPAITVDFSKLKNPFKPSMPEK